MLAANRHWWQFQPFHHRQLCWRRSCPALCAALEALGDGELEQLERDGAAATEWLLPWIADGRRLQELTLLPRLLPRELAFDTRLDHGIPGRKWQQILAFAGCLPRSGEPLLEWCAGKGHLGRLLSTCDRRSVTSLEWRRDLCREGERLAARSDAQMRFVCCDAFAPEAGDWVGPGEDAVALHACGDLHTTLMRHWVRNRSGRLSLSPCCYHLVRGETFTPISEAAARAQVKLSREDLRLPLQETVTAGAGVRRLRQTELHWRLAFDELQRALRGEDSYLPVPNVKKSLLSGSFGEFARWAAERKQLTLPAAMDGEEWLARGMRRLDSVRRMELVAHLFRRPLEIWLVLDRALFLLEQGAEVQIGEFCPHDLTPRNILLQAHW
ncbi:methyltransferase [Microbulbifer taiwanensis]|uniref:Methyltransferase n=1 Tax=Microbulbifer taiwanensis TaxID=986746 RepID=A0ABW1YK16_9GAMM|nr:methyltransferase [Microbulbifer taiwanensis]